MTKKEELEALRELYDNSEDDPPPDHRPQGANAEGWKPDLNPTQELIFNDPADNVLGYGPKGTGKTIGFGHKFVRHCYENEGALQLIISPSIFTGKEGIWHDIDTLILPAWRDGNKHSPLMWQAGDLVDNPQAGEKMDYGIGLEYTETRLDPETKDRTRWIGNRFGTWSKMILKSIPNESQVEQRITGPAPSGVHIEEMDKTSGRNYWTYPSMQLGRRRGIMGPQQFTASANPKGPRHYVYKIFWEDCMDETGNRKQSFSVYHVPISENLHRLPRGYLERLRNTLKDPILIQQLIDGIWVDRPEGDSIFRDSFQEEIHVRGDAKAGLGLTPIKGWPIIVSHDPGPVNYSAHMMQIVPINGVIHILVFDELNFVGSYKPFHVTVPKILDRMDFWNKRAGQEFHYEHISDDQAFTQMKHDGSYDHATIERISKKRIRMKPCPKGKESVKARVLMLDGLLMEARILISATCVKTIEMLKCLTSKKPKDGEYDPDHRFQPARCAHLHPFDSITYGPFYYAMGPSRLMVRTEKIDTRVFRCGTGGNGLPQM